VSAEDSGVAVALLYEAREFGEQLRQTLDSLGLPVVYEAPARALDRAVLERSHASVIVVNLDAHDDPDLDEVYRLLDDTRYRVVFNDSEVSSSLSGWDQARWMRHLVAKIIGAADIDPPRPHGAESVPAPPTLRTAPAAQATAIGAAEMQHAAAPLATEFPGGSPAARNVIGPDARSDGIDVALPAMPDGEGGSTAAEHSDAASADVAGASVADTGLDFDFDFDSAAAEAATATKPDVAPMPGADDGLDFEFEFDGAAAAEKTAATTPTPTPAVPQVPAADDGLDFDFEFDGDLSALLAPDAGETGATSAADVPDFDSMASAGTPAPASSHALDFAFDDTVAGETAVASGMVGTGAPPVFADASDWALEDIFDGDAPAPPAPAVRASATDFGIQTLRAEEFLAPEVDAANARAFPAEPELSLELIPLEEAVAPAAIDTGGHESRLEAPQAKVRRVWVLGASIGGPEAVREFLAALPRDYPALFLLAQHLGEEFVDLLAKQLAQATALTVRTPTHGERVGHGEVIIMPVAQRLRVDPFGVVVVDREADETMYRPSIDRVLRDAADRFGANAGAIVFSGMSDDAVEGCRYLAAKGGVVYAQHPDSCVVSTMIDGVCEAGVVGFLGSPQELADKLLGDPA
jgi:two-component system chemotaxis response regulator CheB/chemosensory pili system protein ChpB (putative protein-glutamate methylesterase)